MSFIFFGFYRFLPLVSKGAPVFSPWRVHRCCVVECSEGWREQTWEWPPAPPLHPNTTSPLALEARTHSWRPMSPSTPSISTPSVSTSQWASRLCRGNHLSPSNRRQQQVTNQELNPPPLRKRSPKTDPSLLHPGTNRPPDGNCPVLKWEL